MRAKLIFMMTVVIFSNVSLADHNEAINLDEIEVRAPLIDSRILKHPATVETYDKKQIEDSINAATPAQTLKYLPSIQVRERFIGDRNGIIATHNQLKNDSMIIAAENDAQANDQTEKTLRPEFIYRYLVGEIAGQRGDIGTSGAIFYDLAKLERDPRLAERAAKIAA